MNKIAHNSQPKVPRQLSHIVGYGVGDFGLNLFWNSLSQLLLFYYANVLGISPIIAGFIFFAGTIWDALSDPVMAAVAERTKTRWGRYRPYLLFGGAGLGLTFMLLLAPIQDNSSTPIFVLILIHMIFRTFYTLVSVPYSALSSTITNDGRKRTVLSGFRMFFAYSGGLAVGAFAFPIIRATGNGTDVSQIGFFWFAVTCAVISMVCFLICFLTVKEKIDLSRAPQSFKQTFSQIKSSLKHNRSLHTLTIFISFQSAAGLIFGSMLIFYVQSTLKPLQPIELILTANGIIGLLMLPIWTYIAHRTGKRQTWMFSSIVAIAAGIHLAVMGPTIISGFVVQFILISAAQSAYGILIWSMIPDTVEYGEWKTGVRSEAATFGVTLFMQKTSIGVTGLMLGFILQFIGYDAEAVTTAPLISDRIGALVGLGPAILLTLALPALLLHPVTRASHETAQTAINQRAQQKEGLQRNK